MRTEPTASDRASEAKTERAHGPPGDASESVSGVFGGRERRGVGALAVSCIAQLADGFGDAGGDRVAAGNLRRCERGKDDSDKNRERPDHQSGDETAEMIRILRCA